MSHAIRRRTPCNFFRNFRCNNGKSRNVTGLLELLHGQLVNFRFDAFALLNDENKLFIKVFFSVAPSDGIWIWAFAAFGINQFFGIGRKEGTVLK